MKKESILYSLGMHDPAGHRYTVRLEILHPDPKGQTLSLPAWIPGSYLIRDFSRQVETLRATRGRITNDGAVNGWAANGRAANGQSAGAGGRRGRQLAVRKVGNHSWRCEPCRGPLVVEYTVYAWDLSVRGAHFDQSHAFFNGASLFLAVEGQADQPCLLRIEPPAQRRDWKVYTSLPAADGHPEAARRHGFGMYRAPDYDALIDHPVEIGTPQVVRFRAHGAEHELVFSGAAPNLDLARIARDAQKICAAQIALFEPSSKRAPFLDSSDHYVFMTQVTADGYGGLEHRASTALMAARRDLPTIGSEPGASYQTFLGLLSHEYFHTWNVKRIKPAAFAPYDLSRENHTRLLWVFEGFTSYYDDLMLLRSGVIGRNDYLRMLAKTISAVHRGSGRHKQSVAESSYDAWTRYYKQDENSPNALVSYYTKGSLVALGLDLLIRRETAGAHTLDDVMRLLWERYGRDFYRSGAGRGLPENAMLRLVREATGVNVADFIERCVEGREDVPLQQLLPQQGIAMAWKAPSDTPTLDIRTRSQNGQTQIATVYENGAAHAAGLSAGDLLVAIGGLRVGEPATLDALLCAYRPGDSVQMHVFRGDELRAYTAVLRAPAPTECELSFAQADPRPEH
ncbi:peptidase M61 [Candidimonas nitroreducens]|uniref:Peptidase M61 n=2 Tax=Candidimonas nitroreducens TaxID=683354 RepID=A0A225MCZ9_9BURK|nr:PDZ domain-containing protein [Candidimonas nitroreducens]OWT59157.1 peptidase M61 [Candidimonas nitroreducens]